MNRHDIVKALLLIQGQAHAIVSMCEDAMQETMVSKPSREALVAASSGEAESLAQEIRTLCDVIQDAGIKQETRVEFVHDEINVGGRILGAQREGDECQLAVLLRFDTAHLAADARAAINNAVRGES